LGIHSVSGFLLETTSSVLVLLFSDLRFTSVMLIAIHPPASLKRKHGRAESITLPAVLNELKEYDKKRTQNHVELIEALKQVSPPNISPSALDSFVCHVRSLASHLARHPSKLLRLAEPNLSGSLVHCIRQRHDRPDGR